MRRFPSSCHSERAKRNFWEEEKQPCRSSVLTNGKMLTAWASDDELRVTGQEAERTACPFVILSKRAASLYPRHFLMGMVISRLKI